MSPHRGPRTAGLAALTTALLLGLTACAGGSGAGSGTSGSASATPVRGGTYTHVLEDDPAGCLDGAQQRYHVALNIIRQATDSLVDLDPATGKIVPWLATSWQVSNDAKSFTFHLRQGVTFSDGEAFDATAVKDNFDRIVALGAKATGAGPVLAGYVGTTVVDPHTVTVTFAQANIQFLQGLSAAWLGLISPADTKKTADQLCTGAWSGTGPFVIASYTKNDKAVLTRRSGYDWPSAAYHHTGAAYLDKVVFQFQTQAGVRSGALTSGQADSISLVQASDEQTLKAAGDTLHTVNPPGLEQTWIANQKSTLGADQGVRHAISLALDRTQLASLYGSGWAPATGLLSPSTPYFTNLTAYISTDVAKAKQVLDADGWTVGSDGIRTRNGARLSVNVITSFPDQAELIQQQLKAVGIDYPIRTLDNAASAKALAAGDYDFYVWNMTRADPDVLRAVFASGGGAQDYSRALPSAADAPLAAQAGDTDASQRQKDVDAASTALVSSYVAIPELIRAWTYATAPTVHGFETDGEGKIVLYDAWTSTS